MFTVYFSSINYKGAIMKIYDNKKCKDCKNCVVAPGHICTDYKEYECKISQDLVELDDWCRCGFSTIASEINHLLSNNNINNAFVFIGGISSDHSSKSFIQITLNEDEDDIDSQIITTMDIYIKENNTKKFIKAFKNNLDEIVKELNEYLEEGYYD